MGGEAVALPTSLVGFAEWQQKKGNLASAKTSTSQIKSWACYCGAQINQKAYNALLIEGWSAFGSIR